ncbi:helix-turn-helix domain-containing protein [Mycolicibacterium pulveris]
MPRSQIHRSPRHPITGARSVDSAPTLISTAVAAKRLGISPNTIRKYVAAGLISCRRVGPKLLKFDPNEVDRLAQRIDNAS